MENVKNLEIQEPSFIPGGLINRGCNPMEDLVPDPGEILVELGDGHPPPGYPSGGIRRGKMEIV